MDTANDNTTVVPVALIAEAVGFALAAVKQFNTIRPTLNAVGMGLKGHMLKLGQDSLASAKGDYKLASAYFAGATAQAEKQVRQSVKDTMKLDKLPSIKDALASWSPAKSPINTALDKGVDISTAKTWADVQAAVKPKRAPGGATGEAAAQVEDETAKLGERLGATVKALLETLKALTTAEQREQAATVLMQAIAVIESNATEQAATPAAKRERAKRGGSR
jgi:hypothetical protein